MAAVEQVAVDGFFVLSGFLVVRSWTRRPNTVTFVRARLSRLLPGLWLCLVVTAFVIAPMAEANRIGLTEQLHYVGSNAGVLVTEWGIGASKPIDGWNLSLWSLSWELACYAGVVVLGLGGALRTRVLVGLVVIFWVWMAALTMTGLWPQVSGIQWISAVCAWARCSASAPCSSSADNRFRSRGHSRQWLASCSHCRSSRRTTTSWVHLPSVTCCCGPVSSSGDCLFFGSRPTSPTACTCTDARSSWLSSFTTSRTPGGSSW